MYIQTCVYMYIQTEAILYPTSHRHRLGNKYILPVQYTIQINIVDCMLSCTLYIVVYLHILVHILCHSIYIPVCSVRV